MRSDKAENTRKLKIWLEKQKTKPNKKEKNE